jgi:hypothetical protein
LGVFAVWPLTLYFNEFCHAFLFLMAKVSNVLINSDCSTPYVRAMPRYVLCRVASSPSISQRFAREQIVQTLPNYSSSSTPA